MSETPAVTHNAGRVCLSAAVVVLSLLTVPRALINYGVDGDTVRGIITARELWRSGVYYPSRLPGAPLFEYILAPLSALDGYILVNAVIFGTFLLCVLAFRRLVNNRRHATLLLTLFAFTPLLLVDAVTAKDYIPGLGAVLWSYVAARDGRFGPAALLLGIAVGMRVSNILFAFPLFLYWTLETGSVMRSFAYTAGGAALGLLCYIPVVAHAGYRAFHIPASGYSGFGYFMVTVYTGIMALGPAALAVLAVSIIMKGGVIAREAARLIRTRDPEFAVEITALGLFSALFAVHSDRSDYLIPAIPFLYLALDRWADRRTLIILVAAVISFGFITLDFKGGESGRRRPTIRPAPGILVADYLERLRLERLRAGVNRAPVPDRSVILTGYGPVLGFDNPQLVQAEPEEFLGAAGAKGITEANFVYRLKDRPVFFVSGLSKDNALKLQELGWALFYFSDSAPSLLMHTYGYHPEAIGAQKLEVRGSDAFFQNAAPNRPED